MHEDNFQQSLNTFVRFRTFHDKTSQTRATCRASASDLVSGQPHPTSDSRQMDLLIKSLVCTTGWRAAEIAVMSQFVDIVMFAESELHYSITISMFMSVLNKPLTVWRLSLKIYWPAFNNSQSSHNRQQWLLSTVLTHLGRSRHALSPSTVQANQCIRWTLTLQRLWSSECGLGAACKILVRIFSMSARWSPAINDAEAGILPLILIEWFQALTGTAWAVLMTTVQSRWRT